MATGKTASVKNAPEVEKKSNTRKTCFIVAPIGSEGSEVRRAIEGLLDAVLRPVLEDLHGYHVEVAHKISASGSISDQIMNFLLEADLVVVDLTGLNPNVMYELAIRHCIGLPLVVIARDGTSLPFDVVQERTIFYHNDMHGVVDLKDRLDTAVRNVNENGGQTDNPVTRSRKAQVVREQLKSGEGGEADVMKFVLDQINDLKSMILRSSSLSGIQNNTSAIGLSKKRYFSDELSPAKGLAAFRISKELELNGFKGFVFNENKNVDDGRREYVIVFNSELSKAEEDRLVELIAEIRSDNQYFVVNTPNNSFVF